MGGGGNHPLQLLDFFNFYFSDIGKYSVGRYRPHFLTVSTAAADVFIFIYEQ
jgi:hypothetical protein